MRTLFALYLLSTGLAFSFSKKAPSDNNPQQGASSSSSSSSAQSSSYSSSSSDQNTPSSKTRDKILEHVKNSSCYKYRWKNRGQIPLGFLQGMGLTFYKNKDQKTTPLGSYDKDSLTYYGINDVSKASEYTFLVGLAMRESSGRHCVGRDVTASSSGGHITTEAGPFQFSYNSRVANPKLSEIYEFYKKDRSGCERELYSRNVTCKASDWVNHGTGEGVNFQKLAKECPVFSVEYGAVIIRSLRKHFGPIIRKEVEYNKDCLKMFNEISKF